MISIRKRHLVILLLVIYSNICQTASAAQKDPTDSVRILIDISGSMKQNDPHNLRAPALRMLANLLPKESRASVWTFAKYANELVPYRQVDTQWQKDASKKSYQIGSPGQFTDIENALIKIRKGWDRPSPDENRSIILLTDGMVDVSKDPEESKASRKKIISALLPQLRLSKIKVHTIALSKNADIDLMKQLSENTDGAFRMAESADALQRIFLHLFERAVKRDTVPLKGNKFKIDKSIDECTILVFTKPNAPPVEITPPSSPAFNSKNAPKGFKWIKESTYELITVTAPPAGEWRITTEEDPDNRVMIVTDLKLKATEIPSNVLTGETFDLEAYLLENGEVINREDFLKLVEFKFRHFPPDRKKTNTWTLEDHGMGSDTNAKDGIYSFYVGKMLRDIGIHELVVNANGRTFERRISQQVRVFESPLIVDTKPTITEENLSYRIDMELVLDWVDNNSIKIIVEFIQPDGLSEFLDVEKSEKGWFIDLNNLEFNRRYSAKIQFKADTLTGRTISANLPLIDLFQQQKVEEPPPPPPEEVVIKQEEPKEPEDKGVNWALVIGMVVGVNLFAGIIFFGFYMMLNKKSKNIPSLPVEDEIDIPSPDDSETSDESGGKETSEGNEPDDDNTGDTENEDSADK